MPDRKPFEGLDAPLDRLLRHMYERLMWTIPQALKKKLEELLPS